MDNRWKQISIGARKQHLHIETPLGIINVRTGLRDDRDREVVSVSMIPDQYAGECPVMINGNRMIKTRVKTHGYRRKQQVAEYYPDVELKRFARWLLDTYDITKPDEYDQPTLQNLITEYNISSKVR